MVKYNKGGNKLPVPTVKLHRWRELCVRRRLKEGLVQSFLAVITTSFRVYDNVCSGFPVRVGYASKGISARKQGDWWGTRQRSTKSQVTCMEALNPREISAVLLCLVRGSSQLRSFLQAIWRSTETGLHRGQSGALRALCSKWCWVPSVTNEAHKTKTKLLAKSWILPLLVLGL